MNKNIFFISLSLILVIVITACNSIGVTDDPYGPTLNCDPDKPIDEIIKCVDDKYAFMDKIHKSVKTKERELFFVRYKRNKDIYLDSKEISSFPELKDNKLYDRNKNGSGAFQVRDDKYKNMTLGIYQNSHGYDQIGYKLLFPLKEGPTGNYIINIDINTDIQITRKYTKSYWSPSKDILIINSNNKKKLYAANYEVISLKKNKAIYVINISTYCQRIFSKEEIKFAQRKGYFPNKKAFPIYTLPLESKDKSFDSCGSAYLYFLENKDEIPEYINNYFIHENEQSNQPFVYTSAKSYGIYVDYKKHPNKIINLSADKRENPTKLYVNLYDHTFEIPLTKEGVFIKK